MSETLTFGLAAIFCGLIVAVAAIVWGRGITVQCSKWAFLIRVRAGSKNKAKSTLPPPETLSAAPSESPATTPTKPTQQRFKLSTKVSESKALRGKSKSVVAQNTLPSSSENPEV
jgi:hypothetical protein